MKTKTEQTLVQVIIAAAITALLGLVALVLTGCAGSGPKWRETGAFLAQRAMSIAGRVVLNSALGVFSDDDADFLDSAAAGLRTEMNSIVTADDVCRVVAIWTPNTPKWQALGCQLADTFTEASRGAERPAVVEALATGLNAAAASDRQP